ncbi:MAG TPA: DUF3052 domain-containing protein [Thermoanaerobaculia bacterium]|nr:DUF3052 domain-containing protein [Thermoanaerobaculia bacterium]
MTALLESGAGTRMMFVVTAGYSGKPLAQKLGLRAGQRIAWLGAPAGFAELLGPLPHGIDLVAPGERELDLVVLFATSAARLVAELAPAAARLTPAGMLWVAWPKKSSRAATDLTEDRVRSVGLGAGLVDVKVCAIDDTWSGLKLVRRLRDRPQPARRRQASPRHQS